jgi:hypothetical protein
MHELAPQLEPIDPLEWKLWHGVISAAVNEAVGLKDQVLYQAEKLKQEPAGYRYSMVRELISQARNAGIDINDEIVEAAGYKTPAEYWRPLDAPMREDVFIQLLAVWQFNPEEVTPRTAVHKRLKRVLEIWLDAGEGFEGFVSERNGHRYLKNPRHIAKMLMASPVDCDLVPASLAKVLVAEPPPPAVSEPVLVTEPPLPAISEPAPTQPVGNVSEGELMRWIRPIAHRTTVDGAWKLANNGTTFPGKHVSKARIRLALRTVRGSGRRRGRPPRGTGPAPRPKIT